MAVWNYTGRSATGRQEQGSIEANSKEEVLSLLRRRRMSDVVVKKKPTEIHLSFGTGVRSVDIARFTRQFAVMNSAGLALLQSLQVLAEQNDNPAMKKIINRVAASVSGGSNLSQALSQHPKIFSRLYVHMVAAGEAGGALESVLNRLAEYQESSERLKRKVKGAMTYPAIVALVAVVVVAVLLTMVVPKFAEIFQSNGGELPLPTQIVMGISAFLQNNILLILIGVVLVVLGFLQVLRVPKGRYVLDQLKLKIPVLKDLELKSTIARFARTVGTLLNSGVSIMDALEVTAKTSGNAVVEQAILKTRDAIAGGKPLAEPMKDCGLFPGMVVQMVAVGERTGGLGTMLIKVADFYDEEVDAAVDALTSMIEPLIIVFLGIVIGFILISMYMPMFSMTDNIN